ncbi:MAG: c-type cytochrome [Bacteroidota bacterium]
MKKTFFAISIVALLAACGNDSTTTTTTGTTTDTQTEPAAFDTANNKSLADNPDYQKGLALVAQSDCLTCHKISEAFTGPAYTEVAKKYAGQPELIDSLANTIIMGSTGKWGQAVMTPHPTLSTDDARAMVKYILTLKQ